MSQKPKNTTAEVADLCRALASMQTPSENRCFLEDILSPAELEQCASRWAIAVLLLEGNTQQQVVKKQKVAPGTVGRVANAVSRGNGTLRLALTRSRNQPR